MAGHDGYTRYTVRIPDALYERIKRASGEKSVNAEIVETLEEKFPEPTLAARHLVPYIEAAVAGMKAAESEEALRIYDGKLRDVLFSMLTNKVDVRTLFSEAEVSPFLVTDYDRSYWEGRDTASKATESPPTPDEPTE